MTLQGSVVDGFVGWAKEAIYERASNMGLRFDTNQIVNRRNQDGVEMVYLHIYERPVVDETTGETTWKEENLMEFVFNQEFPAALDRDPSATLRIKIPKLVIVRQTDGKVLDGEMVGKP